MAPQKTRNLGRISEIAQVAVRHGFGYFFESHRLSDLLPWTERPLDESGMPVSQRGVHLREMLDELGPTFVKFGQLFSMRPVPGWSDYRTPVRALYMCGAATHPGGGVMGAAGRNAATEILRNL